MAHQMLCQMQTSKQTNITLSLRLRRWIIRVISRSSYFGVGLRFSFTACSSRSAMLLSLLCVNEQRMYTYNSYYTTIVVHTYHPSINCYPETTRNNSISCNNITTRHSLSVVENYSLSCGTKYSTGNSYYC